jgi:hypothetical protein
MGYSVRYGPGMGHRLEANDCTSHSELAMYGLCPRDLCEEIWSKDFPDTKSMQH